MYRWSDTEKFFSLKPNSWICYCCGFIIPIREQCPKCFSVMVDLQGRATTVVRLSGKLI